MSEIIKSEAISRRKVLSLLGFVAPFGLAASSTVLIVSEAGAQTVGMERRLERRMQRTERRQERRMGRTERREARRTGRTERREERRN
jgi:heme O synthase-like polyprenyltransferase